MAQNGSCKTIPPKIVAKISCLGQKCLFNIFYQLKNYKSGNILFGIVSNTLVSSWFMSSIIIVNTYYDNVRNNLSASDSKWMCTNVQY